MVVRDVPLLCVTDKGLFFDCADKPANSSPKEVVKADGSSNEAVFGGVGIDELFGWLFM